MTGRAPRQTISIAEASVGIFVVLNSIYSFQHSGGKLPALLAISAVTMCCLVSAMRSKVAIIGLAPASVFAIFSISNPIPVIIAVASIVALLISRDMLPSTLPTIVSVPMAMILKHPELDATSSELLILTSLTLGAAIVMGVVILRANTLRALQRKADVSLSSELHDNVTSKLSSAVILLESMQSSLRQPSAETCAQLPLAKSLIRSAAEGARNINVEIAKDPSMLPPNGPVDVHTLIWDQIRTLRTMGIEVLFSTTGPRTVTPHSFNAAVREAFVNIHKYANPQQPVTVSLDTSCGVHLEVENSERSISHDRVISSQLGIAQHATKLHLEGGRMKVYNHGKTWRVSLEHPRSERTETK